jgi:hypothetical protein
MKKWRNKILNKGELFYQSPSCSIIGKIFYFSIILIILPIWILLIINGNNTLYFSILCLLGILIGILICSNKFLGYHFNIYKNGITSCSMHYFHPFCSHITFLNFYFWKEIIAFDKDCNRKDNTIEEIRIYLKEKKETSIFRIKNVEEYFISHNINLKDLEILSNKLTEKNIREISWFCPKCKKEQIFPTRKCIECGFKRF